MKQRVLIVEDDPLLALDLADELLGAGLDVIGPAPTVSRALDLIRDEACDAAVIDVHLGRELSTPVAQRLQDLGIQFVVLTGYSSEQLPPEFGSAPILSKPAPAHVLVAELMKCKCRR